MTRWEQKKWRQTTLTGEVFKVIKRKIKDKKEKVSNIASKIKQYVQTTIQGDTIHDEDSRHFGDVMGVKSEDIFRFAGQNAARLPIDWRHGKSRKFISTIREYDIDGFCSQEIGIDWDDIDT